MDNLTSSDPTLLCTKSTTTYTSGHVLAFILSGALAYLIAKIVYNIFFHPLSPFPGPIIYAATPFARIYQVLQGNMVFEIKNLHERYGPIVRITPNELSFADPDAWKDIYGHRPEGELAKWDGLYKIQGNLSTTHILSASKEEHRMLRKQLAHGFSERAMRAQEPIIGGYVDLLIQRLREETSEASKVVDMKDWINFTTFDVIGNLAFGSDFGCLADSKWHPWVKMIATHVKVVAYLQMLRGLGLVWITQFAMRSGLISSHADHAQNVHEKMRRRAELGVERLDLVEGLIQKQHELTLRRIEMNASVLILAGSETTATLLSGAVFALLTNPDQMAKLTDEVRSMFNKDDEITLTSVQKLTYMLACLDETLRVYPPIPGGLPRITPREGAVICGRHIPGKTVVSVWHWAMSHHPDHWTDPHGYHPERFLGDPKFANDRRDAMQPFSLGARNCIGRNLAYAEMRLILARLIFNFDMKLLEASKDWFRTQKAYFIWDKPDMYVELTPVKPQ